MDGPGGGGDGGVGGGGEGDHQTVEGSVLQTHDVIFPSEADGGGERAGDRQDYDVRTVTENYSNISFRQSDPSRENYSSSDHWDERTHIKLNPLYQNYS